MVGFFLVAWVFVFVFLPRDKILFIYVNTSLVFNGCIIFYSVYVT